MKTPNDEQIKTSSIVNHYYGNVIHDCSFYGCTWQTMVRASVKNSNEDPAGTAEMEDVNTEEFNNSTSDENTMKEDAVQKRRGRPKSEIFNNPTDEPLFAVCIARLYHTYYCPKAQQMLVEGDYYDETQFLLCIYYVLVKRGFSPVSLTNKAYYTFLTDVCGIVPQKSEKTFNNQLNKVLRTGKPFHFLTPEILSTNHRVGEMTVDELPIWQRTFAVVERLMEQ